MADHNLQSITKALGELEVERDGSHDTESARFQLVDTPEAVRSLISTLGPLETSLSDLYIDIEGVNLSRHGTISLIQIWVPAREQAFLVDVHTLGMQAFTAATPKGISLKDLLESGKPTKYLFDVRNDSDALHGLFGITLDGVVDIQLLELASRQGPKHTVCSLASCMKNEQALPGPALHQWQITKTEVARMFDPKLGGSYEVFNQRPLSKILVDYCVGDIQYLPTLAATYQSRLNKGWMDKVRAETTKRLEESKAQNYESKGKHKIFGPKKWRFPPKEKCRSAARSGHSTTHILLSATNVPARETGQDAPETSASKKTTTTKPTPAIHTPAQIPGSTSSLQTAVPTRAVKAADERLRHRPITFVKEGVVQARKGKKKRSLASSSSPGPNSTWNQLEGQDWALCDKDCGWCGRCAEGVDY